MAESFSNTPPPETPQAGAPTLAAAGDRPQDRAALVAEGRRGRSTGKSLIGKPVITLDDGAQIGETHDVVYNPREGRLIGFTLLQGAGLFRRGDTYWLPAEDIRALGEDAVTIMTADHLVRVEGDVNEYAAQAGQGVLGKRLMTEDGKFLGAIDDVLIERTSKNVVAYEVSGGVFQDMYKGQTDVPIKTVTSIGQDVVIVPSFVQDIVAEPKGGLVATAAAAHVKAGELSQEASVGIATVRTQAAEAIERKEADYALGKQAGRDVADDAGLPIVTTGQYITQAHIQRAIAAGKMHALATSAGYDQAGDAVAATKEKAGDLSGAARVKLAQAGDAIEDKHGDLLLGKTTGHAVLADGGLPLIPANHVITESDVMVARATGKLDDLTLAVGAAVLGAGKDHVAAAYDATKTGAANAYDAASARLAEAQAVPVQAVPAAPTPVAAPVAAPAVAPVTIIVERGGSVTVETPGTAAHPEADLEKS